MLFYRLAVLKGYHQVSVLLKYSHDIRPLLYRMYTCPKCYFLSQADTLVAERQGREKSFLDEL